MKRAIFSIITVLLLMVLCSVALSEIVTFGRVQASTDAEYLDLGREYITNWNTFYRFLDQFTNLKKVDMFATAVNRDRIAKLVERYPDIEFGWTIQLADHQIRTDQTAFSTLHVTDTPWKHSEIEFGVLKYCKQLKALDLGHNIIKDVSFLYDLPQLRVLILALNQIEDITPIGSLKNLEYLELFINHVTDISPLASLPHLMDLNICRNYIEDLTPLYGMKQLKRLWMNYYNRHGSQNTIGSVEELRKALPDTVIDSTTFDSTDGGWRRPHPHYDVIREIFKTGVYVPFEDSYTEDAAPEEADSSAPQPEPEPTPRRVTIVIEP